MLKIIQRYLVATFIPPFLLGVFFFVCFLLTFQLFRIMNVVINKGVELSTLLILIWDLALSFLPMAVPLSILFAMLYTMSKLSEDSEIIAMRSFGFSKYKLFLPFTILGVFIAWAIFALNTNIIPLSYKQFANTVIKLSSKGTMTDIRSEQFFTDVPNITLFANEVHKSGKNMENVFIHLRTKDENVEHIVFAQKGSIIREGEDNWGLPQLRMRLSQGNITKIEKGSNDVEKILFDQYDFPLLTRDSAPGFVTKDSMKSNHELKMQIDSEKALGHGKEIIKTELEYWSRINTPFLTLVFILLGFTLGIKKSRGRGAKTGPMVLTILVCYYALMFLGISLSKKMILTPFVATFAPTFLAFLVGIYFFRKLDWVS